MEKRIRNVKLKCVILLLILFSASQIFAAPCGEVNSRGASNIVNALQTAQYYVGLVTSSPGGNTTPGPETPEGMVYVEGGTFQMGSSDPNSAADEQPVHTVTLSSFFIGATEVTNTEYCKFLNAYGSNKVIGGEYDGKIMIIEYEWGVRKNGSIWEPQSGYENHPAVPLSWVGAYEYCKWRGVRLPTEAEWEYAARGGKYMTSTLYAGSDNIDDVAWYAGNSSVANSSRDDKRGPMPVKQKAPNKLGIYDMSGNLWEACADWYNENFYSQSANNTNPHCDTGDKTLKVWRGGSWYDKNSSCSVFDRGWRSPTDYLSVFGLRVAASVPGQ